MNAFVIELENTPGGLAKVAEAIAERGINITGVAGATSGELGTVSFTTDDRPPRATPSGRRAGSTARCPS